jgi:YebC/PmpR family DNA-binding regulatory protein
MSGHSKWAQIKRKKGKADAARGKLFSKLIREIAVAARMGGGDPNGNARLRMAMQVAKANNMPMDNINKAIKKAVGSGEGANFEEHTYEGYGPKGFALFIETLTDNKNRTTADVRHALAKHNGNLGENGCVSWIFESKGVIWIKRDQCDEETLLGIALDAGAEDIKEEEEGFEVICSPEDLESLSTTLKERGIPYQSAEMQRVPKNVVKLEGDAARRAIKLMDALEALDDVQRVSANFDIPDEIVQEEE